MKLKIGKNSLPKPRLGSSGKLPYLPIYEPVLFPYTKGDLIVGKPQSRIAIEQAMAGDHNILLCYKGEKTDSGHALKELAPVATLCHIKNFMRYPDKSIRISVEAVVVVELLNIQNSHPAGVQMAGFKAKNEAQAAEKKTFATISLVIKEAFSEYVQDDTQLPHKLLKLISEAREPAMLMSLICSNLKMPRTQKLYFLEHLGALEQLEELGVVLGIEKEASQLKKGLGKRVRERLDQHQKEFILQEQMKEIQRELGGEADDPTGSRELEQRLGAKKLPPVVQERVLDGLQRLQHLPPVSPESGVLRAYLELIDGLPWQQFTEDRIDIMGAQVILDSEHYGLEDAKERILDYLAVSGLQAASRKQLDAEDEEPSGMYRGRRNRLRGPILCLVGPPGTGKTSLGESIAKTLNRKFVRIALGGLRDEVEIRGHRRTYVSALPGKIIQAFRRAQTCNPVILLDEIDKVSSRDFSGAVASALLEVLDPEQNYSFTDNYLELPYDLSRALFITTANDLDEINLPLLDRMEVIEIPGYTIYEKLHIARKYLIPRQLQENGITGSSLEISNETLSQLIGEYTMESGIRTLERVIAKLIRKLVRSFLREQETRPGSYARNSSYLHLDQELSAIDFNGPSSWSELLIGHKWEVTPEILSRYLGTPPYDPYQQLQENSIKGFAQGMAWTSMGGRLLPVEVLQVRGSGSLTLTGKLGEVMKESAQIAYSLIQQLFENYGVQSESLDNQDLHIHVPEGAIPKDGPSAGITIAAAMLSALSGRPVRKDIAMTGEVTLTDQLLPVGGIREKVLAAHRQGFRHVLLPRKNCRDTEKLPEQILESIEFHYFQSVIAALQFLLSEPLSTLD
ncbi:MAG: endopeptidase La [Spirochaetota bacterium]